MGSSLGKEKEKEKSSTSHKKQIKGESFDRENEAYPGGTSGDDV